MSVPGSFHHEGAKPYHIYPLLRPRRFIIRIHTQSNPYIFREYGCLLTGKTISKTDVAVLRCKGSALLSDNISQVQVAYC